MGSLTIKCPLLHGMDHNWFSPHGVTRWPDNVVLASPKIAPESAINIDHCVHAWRVSTLNISLERGPGVRHRHASVGKDKDRWPRRIPLVRGISEVINHIIVYRVHIYTIFLKLFSMNTIEEWRHETCETFQIFGEEGIFVNSSIFLKNLSIWTHYIQTQNDNPGVCKRQLGWGSH